MSKENRFNPSLDISAFSLPAGSTEIFCNSNKCALEIGFGEGEFIAEIASASPDWNFLGIEIKYFRYRKAVRLVEKEKLGNVKLLHIDADIAVEQVFEPATFEMVYINFPDPWPKDRHKKHRIITDNFLDNLYDVMKKGGVIEFTSDHQDYVEHTLDHFGKFGKFTNLHGEYGYSDRAEGRPVTKFENEFIKENRKIYYLAFKK